MSTHPNSFVRRLIPTVAVATLSFAGCGEEPGKKNNDPANSNPNGNPNSAMNMTPNNVTPNNMTPNNVTPNNMTPNNVTPNNVTPNNVTPNNVTPNNVTPNNTMSVVQVDNDGTVSPTEIQAFCQAFSDCDTAYFTESYATVAECAESAQMYHEEYLSYYEMDYGVECANIIDARTECMIAAFVCDNGEFTQSEAASEGCYDQFDAQYDMFCVTP